MIQLTGIKLVDDRDRWDAFVRAHPYGHFFQSWDWGVLQEALDARPVRIANSASDDHRIISAVQLFIFEGSKRFAVIPRGPVSDPAVALGELLDAALRVAAAAGAQLVRMEPQWPYDPAIVERLQRGGFAETKQHIMPPRTLLVDLRPSVEEIWNGLRSNTRNRIRLAEKRGVTVRVGAEADVPEFVRLFDETSARHGLRLGRSEMFAQAARLFGRDERMRLYLACDEGAILAGIMVFIWGATATYLWGASSSSERARSLNPNQLLHWTAMQWARERGCATYDLFGIPDLDAESLEKQYATQSGGWWNLYRFKRGFGGTVHRHLGTFDCRIATRES
ncbi:MAG TPA: peptidoglycan bridge formation glycyltransferase FemA/FemB family protein [Vicinamibacterales bacterium]|nr:peptidoglycan bridge formation glycyltransferase FemA/FemB family protein [Vicinamibacterales bacterium]